MLAVATRGGGCTLEGTLEVRGQLLPMVPGTGGEGCHQGSDGIEKKRMHLREIDEKTSRLIGCS